MNTYGYHMPIGLTRQVRLAGLPVTKQEVER
jgi:hypothetical protein